MHNVQRKILVVDDEVKIVEVVKSYLEKNGFNVIEAYTAKDALDKFENENPNLIILDLMLPDMSGEEICQALRKKSRVPIIMLTAKVEEDDLLKGLNIGADDYVTKPFPISVFQKKVSALLNRISAQSGGDFYDDGNLYINFSEFCHAEWISSGN